MGKFFYLLGTVLVIMSCGKDIDLFIPRTESSEIGELEHLMSRLRDDIAGDIKYVVSVPCEGNSTFEVDKDVIISIPPDFVDLSVYPCTNGYFDMHITICDTKGEILIAGIPTLSEGKLLESRIEINLQLLDGIEEVRLAAGKQINIKVNDPDPRDRMELFYGNKSGTEWVQADNDPDTWDNVTNNEWWLNDSTGQIIQGFGYELWSDSLDWINIDAFIAIPQDQRTDVCIELPDGFTNKNTAVFMVLDDYNSILPMIGNADIQKFCEPYASAPIGFRVTFVVISEMGDGTYRFTAKPTTITPHHSEILNPLNTPYEEIKNYILGL